MPEENWENIHEDFGKIQSLWSDKIYRMQWESKNFTYKEAKEWIDIGFAPWNLDIIIKWKEQEFDCDQVKSWIEKGLTLYEVKFATYLKQNNYQSFTINLERARTEYSQDWLHTKYPQQQTKEIEIDWKKKNFHGGLVITDYPQLERIEIIGQNNLTNLQINNCPRLVELDCSENRNFRNLTISNCLNLEILNLSYNSLTNLNLTNQKKLKELDISNSQLTNLNINHLKDLEELNVRNNNFIELGIKNCINLKKLDCSYSKLTNLDLANCVDLQIIDCSNNQLTQIKLPINGKKLECLNLNNNNFNQDLSFLSHSVNLKRLELGNNRFQGSLEPLQKMSKLEVFDISNTDIDSGLEYLPGSVRYFWCLTNKRSEAKVKVIYDLFANEQREAETDHSGIKNFPQKFQEYKEKLKAREFLKDEFQVYYEQQIQELKEQLSCLEKENKKNKEMLQRKEDEIIRLKDQLRTETSTHASTNMSDIKVESISEIKQRLEEKQKKLDKLKNERLEWISRGENTRKLDDEIKKARKELFYLNKLKEISNTYQGVTSRIKEKKEIWMRMIKSLSEKVENHRNYSREEIRKKLWDLSRAQAWDASSLDLNEKSFDSFDEKMETIGDLVKNTSIAKWELDEFCQLQKEITGLENELGNIKVLGLRAENVTNNYFSGNFSNFTGGVGNSGNVEEPQAVNVSPQAKIEQQTLIVHNNIR